jgi:aspartokinase
MASLLHTPAMLLVQKFGGTSVGSAGRIAQAAALATASAD